MCLRTYTQYIRFILHTWLYNGCSNAKQMPSDVQDALKAVCVEHGGLTEEEAAALLNTMETSKRLQLETWS